MSVARILGAFHELCAQPARRHLRNHRLLGKGGMGEVYRARDGALNRDVAIKVLPAVMAGDPDRLGRFKREAQLLASLNHPNIAHVYGFERATLADGSAANSW